MKRPPRPGARTTGRSLHRLAVARGSRSGDQARRCAECGGGGAVAGATTAPTPTSATSPVSGRRYSLDPGPLPAAVPRRVIAAPRPPAGHRLLGVPPTSPSTPRELYERRDPALRADRRPSSASPAPPLRRALTHPRCHASADDGSHAVVDSVSQAVALYNRPGSCVTRRSPYALGAAVPIGQPTADLRGPSMAIVIQYSKRKNVTSGRLPTCLNARYEAGQSLAQISRQLKRHPRIVINSGRARRPGRHGCEPSTRSKIQRRRSSQSQSCGPSRRTVPCPHRTPAAQPERRLSRPSCWPSPPYRRALRGALDVGHVASA